MIRREFLLTAGITVAAVSIMGPAVWADGVAGQDAESTKRAVRGAGWMHGNAGGCATVVSSEPPFPVGVTA